MKNECFFVILRKIFWDEIKKGFKKLFHLIHEKKFNHFD